MSQRGGPRGPPNNMNQHQGPPRQAGPRGGPRGQPSNRSQHQGHPRQVRPKSTSGGCPPFQRQQLPSADQYRGGPNWMPHDQQNFGNYYQEGSYGHFYDGQSGSYGQQPLNYTPPRQPITNPGILGPPPTFPGQMTGPSYMPPPSFGQPQAQPQVQVVYVPVPVSQPNEGSPATPKYPPPLIPGLQSPTGNLNIIEESGQKDGEKSSKKKRGKSGHGKEQTPDRFGDDEGDKKSKQKGKSSTQKGQELGSQKNQEDDGFLKLKSLLSEEPEELYRGEPEDCENVQQSANNNRGRGRRRRGGRGRRGRGGKNVAAEDEQESECSDNNSSDDDNANFDQGCSSHITKGHHSHGLNRITSQSVDSIRSQGQKSDRGTRRGGRGRGSGQGRGQGHKHKDESEDYNALKDNKVQGYRGRGGSGRGQNKGERQKHEKNEDADEDIVDVDDNEVFKFLIKHFGGGCTFEDFIKKCDLFPIGANITAWFNKHNRRFHIFRDKRSIVYVQPFYRDVKICEHYINKKNLGRCEKNDNCDYFHICRYFVRGACKQDSCPLAHSFKTPHNRHLKEKLGINDFTDTDIRIILNCNSPSLCKDYIYNKGICTVPDSEKRCPHLHLCRNFLFRKCAEPCKFKLTHSIKQFHNSWVITSCHMKGWPVGRVLKYIYVPPRDKKETEDYSDESDFSQDEDRDENESVCSYDSDVSVESSYSTSSSFHNKKFNKLIQSMEKLSTDEREDIDSSREVKLGRKGRFKSTDNIICGIVGKDDGGFHKMSVLEDQGAIPKKRAGSYTADDDDDDIKEKERILMEKWKMEKQGLSGSSDRLIEKPPVKPRLSKKKPTDYLEKDPKLLTDETENTNICIHVTNEKCPAKTCKNHHLQSGIPYLWQIKMFGKWLSFPLKENEKIEKEFCNLVDVVSTEMTYSKCRYGIHICFSNPIYGVIYDIDDQVAGDDHKCVVRRLSTPSFAEKKMTTDCYLTQWRWYWKDDSQNWIKYDKPFAFLI